MSSDGHHVLFASKLEDKGSEHVAPYTDVKLATVGDDGGVPAVKTLVPTTTSCPSCLFDSFTRGGSFGLVIDPIDNSTAAGGVGSIHVFDLASGAMVSSFEETAYTTVGVAGNEVGLATRFMLVAATPDSTLSGGQAFTLSTRSLDPKDRASEIAVGVERLSVDSTRTRAVFSFAMTSPWAGIWVAPL
jgi:hypothetical protein